MSEERHSPRVGTKDLPYEVGLGSINVNEFAENLVYLHDKFFAKNTVYFKWNGQVFSLEISDEKERKATVTLISEKDEQNLPDLTERSLSKAINSILASSKPIELATPKSKEGKPENRFSKLMKIVSKSFGIK